MELEDFVEKKQGKKHKSFRRIGGGYYADVYKADYENESIIIKVHKSKGLTEREIEQIKLLSEHSLSPMPEILWVHGADAEFDSDAFAMTLLDGVNGGTVCYLSKSKRERLADDVINNLLAFHNVKSIDGFGTICGKRYATFNEYYREKAYEIAGYAQKLYEKGQLPEVVLSVVKKAVEGFDKVFYLPITEASLIHGDYNMWNILVDKGKCSVSAVIDPCGCMWADSEYDLYQLNNANGRHLKLFKKYSEKKTLSENCMQKMAFYELFTEIEHYYNSGYPVNKKRLQKCADKLEKYL